MNTELSQLLREVAAVLDSKPRTDSGRANAFDHLVAMRQRLSDALNSEYMDSRTEARADGKRFWYDYYCGVRDGRAGHCYDETSSMAKKVLRCPTKT